MKQLAAFFVLASFAIASQPLQWQTEMAAALTDRLGTEISFIETGPQTIFYADELPEASGNSILEVLEVYRGNALKNGNLVVLGFSPEIAYIANAVKAAEQLTNTSMVGTYASLVDGRDRRIGSVSGQSFTGCISSSGADGASVRCSDGGSQTFETNCQTYGKEIICRSTD